MKMSSSDFQQVPKPFGIISVIGLGYVGLPTAAMFASRNTRVIGVDTRQETVDCVNRGEIHIEEPGLADAVKSTVSGGFLRATSAPEPADAFLIAVPTPFRTNDRSPDLSYVEAASRSVARVLVQGNLVVLESTSPVGASEAVARWMSEERPDLVFPGLHGMPPDIHIAHCPERVLPGQAMFELVRNDRVIGGLTPACSARAVELYETIVEGQCFRTDARTAELAKLAENSFRDVNIAFANELSMICDRLDIDVRELIELSNRHPRVNILHPGPGVGGHCIAVDPWFIVASAPDEARIIRTAREVNDSKPDWVISQVNETAFSIAAQTGRRPRVACFGLTFKPDIDDLRESPALHIVRQLAGQGDLDVLAIEPHVSSLPADMAGTMQLAEAGEALEDADIVLLLVAHREFSELKFATSIPVIDTCGLTHRKQSTTPRLREPGLSPV